MELTSAVGVALKIWNPSSFVFKISESYPKWTIFSSAPFAELIFLLLRIHHRTYIFHTEKNRDNVWVKIYGDSFRFEPCLSLY